MVNWQDILNPPAERNYRDTGGTRGSTSYTPPPVMPPPNNGTPGGSGPITTPGIPEDQVTHLPPPPDYGTPPSQTPWGGPSADDIMAPYFRGSQYSSNRGSTSYTPPAGTGQGWVNPGQTENFWGGLSDYLGNYGDGGNRGGNTNPYPDAGATGTSYMYSSNDPLYTGPGGLQPGDSRFWNMPANMQSSYFERLAVSRIGDYDRAEPDIDPATGQPIPGTGGQIISGPKTTAIRQLMADLEATARAQMLQGYQPSVRY
ncbi:MAG: hypothetical protein E6Q97_10425 [Desulfurellales bacterium]|nr:MAG: hypothetical protein E6Q97_10425 [Desulfurellales bacterium]